MSAVLFLLAMFVGFIALAMSGTATTSIHQIYGGVLWIITTLLFVGALIVAAIQGVGDKIVRELKPPDPAVPKHKSTFFEKLLK